MATRPTGILGIVKECDNWRYVDHCPLIKKLPSYLTDIHPLQLILVGVDPGLAWRLNAKTGGQADHVIKPQQESAKKSTGARSSADSDLRGPQKAVAFKSAPTRIHARLGACVRNHCFSHVSAHGTTWALTWTTAVVTAVVTGIARGSARLANYETRYLLILIK